MSFLKMEEKVSYVVAPEAGKYVCVCTWPNSSPRTLFKQEAAVAVTGYSSVCTYIEEFFVNRFQSNAEKGRMGLEDAIRRLMENAGDQRDQLSSLPQ